MRKYLRVTILFFILISSVILCRIIYKKYASQPKKEFFSTENPQRRNIYQVIYATGKLEIKGIIKVGSLVAGTIKKIFVEENDKIKKGQLLTEIDNGKEDTSVRMAQGELEKTKADLVYLDHNFPRQKALFAHNQISKDSFEQIERDYEKAKADLKIKQAALDKEQIEFNNTKIYAPDDGIIVSVGITEGQKITTDLDATVLFQIATDINKMEATLDIDESDIGHIKKGQKVHFVVGTYLDKTFKAEITDISYSPETKNNIICYQATVEVDNKKKLLWPGMTVNAKINVSKAKESLSISSQAFQINAKMLEQIAKSMQFKILALPKDKKKELEKDSALNSTIKYVWIVKEKLFEEKAIQVGITDDNFFEIKSGLNDTDQVVIDVKEDDEMTSLYEKMFRGVL